MVWKPPRAYFLPKSNYQKKFQLKIPILRKIDCSAIYAHAMMGLIFIWDLLVMCPGAKNRFRLSGGIRWQIFLLQISSDLSSVFPVSMKLRKSISKMLLDSWFLKVFLLLAQCRASGTVGNLYNSQSKVGIYAK